MSQLNADMRRYMLGQRFVDTAVESDFRIWRRQATFPVMWLGMWAAAFSWVATPLVVNLLSPELNSQTGPILYFFTPLYLLLSMLGFIRRARRYALPVVICANCIAGFVMIWFSYYVGGSIGGAVAATTLILFYAPFMRLPPESAFLATAPYILVTAALAFQSGQHLTLPVERMAYVVVPCMSLLTVVLVCLVLEHLLRTSYTRECLIQSQRNELENASRQIRRYVPDAVANQILGGHGEEIDQPQRRRITILFCDLVGFTDVADRIDPESLTQILSDYMSGMARIIESHGGTLNEFAGDGLMALFGAPNAMAPEDQAKQAIQAAQSMQAKMPTLNAAWRKLGLGAELKTRIGINTGMVSVGSYGSEGRMTYTAIGLQTNIASRIESAAKPGEILISDATYQLISDTMACEPKGEVECKGVHFPVKVYAPVMT